MSLICTVPSFTYTRHKSEWEWAVFAPLLMRHGPPPKGVKWYGKAERVHFIDADAREWQDKIAADCVAAVERATQLSHYKPLWRERHALNIKNRFIRWCHDEREREIRDANAAAQNADGCKDPGRPEVHSVAPE